MPVHTTDGPFCRSCWTGRSEEDRKRDSAARRESDRARVRRLFGFDQVLEIFKPVARRTYGYYCLPVLAGERLVARFDLKADRKRGVLRVLSCRFEGTANSASAASRDGEGARAALTRYADALELKPTGVRLT